MKKSRAKLSQIPAGPSIHMPSAVIYNMFRALSGALL